MAARYCSLKMHGSIVTRQYGTVKFALANCTSLTQARFIAIGENGNKKCFESENFAFFDNSRFATPDLVQSSPAQHCQFGYPVFVLPSVIREWNTKKLDFLYLFTVAPFTCNMH